MDPATSSASSDTQSTGFLDLIGTLGMAYFGAEAAQASAANQNSLNSTGTSVPTNQPTTQPGQLVAGISNSALVLAGLGFVGLVALVLLVPRK